LNDCISTSDSVLRSGLSRTSTISNDYENEIYNSGISEKQRRAHFTALQNVTMNLRYKATVT